MSTSWKILGQLIWQVWKRSPVLGHAPRAPSTGSKGVRNTPFRKHCGYRARRPLTRRHQRRWQTRAWAPWLQSWRALNAPGTRLNSSRRCSGSTRLDETDGRRSWVAECRAQRVMRVGGELGVVKKMKSVVVFFGKEDGIISGANGSERPDVEVGFVKVGGPWGIAGFHPRELLNSSPQAISNCKRSWGQAWNACLGLGDSVSEVFWRILEQNVISHSCKCPRAYTTPPEARWK